MNSSQTQSQLNQEYRGTSVPAEGSFSRQGNYCDFCDLHVHTTASDGHLTPKEVVQHSLELGLRAISICDHDTMAGYLELTEEFSQDKLGVVNVNGLELIPGIEINSRWEQSELHILGYFIDPGDGSFLDLLSQLRRSRVERVQVTVEKLASLGKPVELSRVLELSQGDSVGRPHIAQAMVEKGYVSTVREAFELYLGIGKPAYVDRRHLSPAQSIRAIREAKGIAVWAHPGITNADWLLTELMEYGLQGIEVFHPEHDIGSQQKYLHMARENRLVVTGGSDFHSATSSEGAMIGSYGISYDGVQALKRMASAVR